jgi:hypothetical protein
MDMQPNPMAETCNPLLPRGTYLMESSNLADRK